VTGGALLGRRLVEQDLFPIDPPGQIVTLCAPRFLMGTLQGKGRSLFVIECRWLPLSAAVAFGARSIPVARELLAVDVFVAFLALGWGCLEIHIGQLGFQVGRLVAIGAGGCAMRTDQRKRRFGVIESRQFFPRLGGVTGLAAGGLSSGPGLAHALLELSLVRIGVAGNASQILPVINSGRLLAE